MLKKILSLLFAVCLCATTFAQQAQQTQQQEEPAQEETVDVTIKIYRWAFSNKMVIPSLSGSGGGTESVRADQSNVDLWYKDAGNYKRLKITSGTMSPPIHYKGPRTMILYERIQNVSVDGEAPEEQFTYKEATRMTIPLGLDEMFALMFKTGKKIRFYPMNVSPTQLPKEKIAVLNMTSTHAAVLVGGETKVLRSGSNAIFKPKSKKETSVELKVARMVDKKWRPVYDTNISTPKGQRCVILLFDPYNRRTPKFSVQLLTL